MALTGFRSGILKSLAANRRANAGSYVAGGLALNYRLDEPRQSRDIDIFHDSVEALFESWRIDRATLEELGYTVAPRRELKTFIEAEVAKDGERTEIQWGTATCTKEMCSILRRRWRRAMSFSTKGASAAPGRR